MWLGHVPISPYVPAPLTMQMNKSMMMMKIGKTNKSVKNVTQQQKTILKITAFTLSKP